MCQWTLLLWAAECESPDASCSDQRRIREGRASRQIAAPVPTCRARHSHAGKEGLRREERGESREALWIKMRVSRRIGAGVLYSYATKWIGGFSLMCATQSCRATLMTSLPIFAQKWGPCPSLVYICSSTCCSDSPSERLLFRKKQQTRREGIR